MRLCVLYTGNLRAHRGPHAPRRPELVHTSPLPNREPAPLRLAIFSGVYDYIADGIALTLNRLVEQLECDDIEVLVFAPSAKTPAFRHAGTLISVPSFAIPGRSEYRCATGLGRTARRRLMTFQPNLFHIAVPDILGLHALRFARQHKIPVLSSYHTRYETYLSYYGIDMVRPLINGYLRKFYASANRVCAPSQSMAEEIEAAGYGRNIHVWGRGVDPQRFHPKKRSSKWRRDLGIGDDEVVLLFVSRLVREKGLDTLVDVVDGLAKRDLRFRCVIVGDGPDRASLENRLPQALFTGFLGGEDLPCAYASSDIFFFPSLTETFGNVTLEAMASGLPVVCADATGSRSLVEPDVTGFLEMPNDAAAFISQLEKLLGSESLRRSMGAAGLERSAEYTQERAYQQLRSVYDGLLRTSGVDD